MLYKEGDCVGKVINYQYAYIYHIVSVVDDHYLVNITTIISGSVFLLDKAHLRCQYTVENNSEKVTYSKNFRRWRKKHE